MKLRKLKKNKAGYTLVETLVAISILSLSILASFTAVQGGLQSSTIAKDQITAFYLTQEVMEFIKNKRDENALKSLGGSGVDWLTGLAAVSSDPCYFGKTCTIDSYFETATTCSGGFGTCPNLNQDSETGLFGYSSSWTPTNFKREVQLTNLSSNEVNVTVSVSWTTRGITRSFQITQIIFNRQ